jgi:Flp pilus assembly pilin Flp
MRAFAAFKTYLKRCDAATAIEYGLIAAAIALGIAVIVFTLGDTLVNVLYNDIPAAFSQ